ncbi:MAG: phenylalanine--tRNA ligase subunit beta [Oscillospiraceae bacterium]
MILSRNWLNEFVDGVDVATIGDRDFSEAMTLSGSKVETFEDVGAEILNVVVGRVLSMKKHENSDHMFICQVDVGGGITTQIVTGAQNVHEGDLVPVAKDGSTLPGGVKITAGELRGEASAGMLCSLKELGMTLHDFPYAIEDGIWILQEDDAQPGDDIRAILGANDHVVEFEITPNRPDCLSVIGLARETAATFGKELRLHTPEIAGCGGSIAELVDIEIEDTDLCPRYTARMVKNVKIAPSPRWMRERLRNSGVRPINNIVDITNYVMLEYGQPMHAFDFSCVKGNKIIVRRARKGEVIQTLDGNDRKLTESMLCICDESRPVCVAGVMGGANSEIVGDTAQVLFESANFNGTSVRRTALALGMRTDASSRYEKGLDPMNTMKAVQRACELVELLGVGEVVDGVMDVIGQDSYPTTVQLEPAKINALLGTDVSEADMRRILLSLGFQLDGDTIVVPSWRGDVEHYSDIAEEIARYYGYNNIPTTLMRGETVRGGYSPIQQTERQVGELCRTLGYDEIITYSFISPTYYDKINLAGDSPLRTSMRILNPLGEDTSIMRTTILPSLLEILARNYNFRNKSARLYELGKVYFAKNDGTGMAKEPKVLSLGGYGDGMDFFRLKGAVETLLTSLRCAAPTFEAVSDNPSYHPGRCARVLVGGREIGVLGQIHPAVGANYGVDVDLYAAELQFDPLFAVCGATPTYTPLPKYPSVTRDIAVVCQSSVSVGALTDCIRRGAKGLLKDVALFDIYTGKGIAENCKSVAFNLTLRADDRNLTAAEADEDVQSILALLDKELGAHLR